MTTITPIQMPAWLATLSLIIGAEGDDPSGAAGASGEAGASNDPASGAGSSPDGTEGSASSSNEHDDADDPKVQGLKSALSVERQRAKELERENRRLARIAQEKTDAEQGELAAAKAQAERATSKVTRLAEGYLRTALDRAIEVAARSANFVDPADAIGGVDRTAISVTQDEEDPTDIEIDVKTVTAAVKKLAAAKPHWIKSGTEDGEPSGSTFGGAGRRRGTPKTSDEELKDRYPALKY